MLRTLIIDDSPQFLASLTDLLGLFAGVSLVGVATSGEDGLRAAAELAPDLVFVDLHMPGLGGLQVAAELCAQEKAPRVVMISLHDDAEYRARAAAVGAESFVCKRNLFTKLAGIIAGPPPKMTADGGAP